MSNYGNGYVQIFLNHTLAPNISDVQIDALMTKLKMYGLEGLFMVKLKIWNT